MDCSTNMSSESSILDAQWASLSNEWMAQTSSSLDEVTKIAQKAFENTKTSTIQLFNKLQDKISCTELPPLIAKVHSLGTDIEKIFNIAGCLPWLGVLSGTVRSFVGQVQTTLGIALTTLSELGLIFGKLSKVNTELISKWKILSKLGIELTVHGCLNTIRGTGEMLIGTYTLGLGNMALILPNLSNNHNFAPYFPYGSITHPSSLNE